MRSCDRSGLDWAAGSARCHGSWQWRPGLVLARQVGHGLLVHPATVVTVPPGR